MEIFCGVVGEEDEDDSAESTATGSWNTSGDSSSDSQGEPVRKRRVLQEGNQSFAYATWWDRDYLTGWFWDLCDMHRRGLIVYNHDW